MKRRKVWLWVGVVVVVLVLFLLLLRGLGRISLEGHGHGLLGVSGGESFLTSLGIRDNFDYVDKESGEGFCFDDVCWDGVEAEYDLCVLRLETMIGGVDDYASCDEVYEETLISDCSQRCEEEVFVWDGSSVSDLGVFSGYAFPDFTSNSRSFCEAWFIGGTWVSVPEKVGCEDASFIFCGSQSLLSAEEVCGSIGKVWVCDFSNAYCMSG